MRPAPRDIAALWPNALQIVACHTRYTARHPRWKTRKAEWHYYVLCGPKGKKPLSPRRAAEIVRGHWGIENRCFHVKDRKFREDDQKVRSGALALCWLRTIAMTALEEGERKRRGPRRYMTAIRAEYCARPRKALRLMKTL